MSRSLLRKFIRWTILSLHLSFGYLYVGFCFHAMSIRQFSGNFYTCPFHVCVEILLFFLCLVHGTTFIVRLLFLCDIVCLLNFVQGQIISLAAFAQSVGVRAHFALWEFKTSLRIFLILWEFAEGSSNYCFSHIIIMLWKFQIFKFIDIFKIAPYTITSRVSAFSYLG